MAQSAFRSRLMGEYAFACIGLVCIILRNRFGLGDVGWVLLFIGVMNILVEIAWAVDDLRNQRR